MKGSAFLVVGGLVVVGAVAYGVYRYMASTKETTVKPSHESDIQKTEHQTEKATTTPPVVADLDKTKEDVIASMKATRKEAAQAIEGSLNTIFNEAEEDLVTENTETLNKISSDLEDLLK